MIDWTKPIRFTRVQGDDHAHYQPKVVGSYVNPNGKTRYVVVLRHWDHAPSLLIYNEDGEPLHPSLVKDATAGTGIFDVRIVNGDPIRTIETTVLDHRLIITFDGDDPVAVRKA